MIQLAYLKYLKVRNRKTKWVKGILEMQNETNFRYQRKWINLLEKTSNAFYNRDKGLYTFSKF